MMMQKETETLTVRGLDADTKRRLRVLAAQHGRSMEEEVRGLIRDAVRKNSENRGGLGTAIHELFAELDGPELELLPREGVREPPDFNDPEYDPK